VYRQGVLLLENNWIQDGNVLRYNSCNKKGGGFTSYIQVGPESLSASLLVETCFDVKEPFEGALGLGLCTEEAE